jgi:hypothetical protein
MTFSAFMVVAVFVGDLFLTGSARAEELTVQQNMDEQKKMHIIPGKTLTAKGPNYQFCEVAPIHGTTKENAVADFYNPTGIDHCTPEDFEKIVALKDQIIKETGAIDVFLNPSRHWTWDEFEVFEVGDERMPGPVKMAWMAVVQTEAMKKAAGSRNFRRAGNSGRKSSIAI